MTKSLLCGALAIGLAAMAGCAPQQTPHDATGTQGGSTAGNGWQQNSGGGSGTYTFSQPSPAGTVAGGTVDHSRSQALSEYLKTHHLPLVSAQVVSSPSGAPQVILFGYVATEYGKSDAEQKARTYLKSPSVLVDNRIQISPELAGDGSNGGNGNGSRNSTNDPYASAGSVQDYQNQFDPYAAQQQYMNQQGPAPMSPGMTSLLLGLLGGGFGVGSGGASFGGGGIGFGGGGGGFGVGGSSSYGGYGYPYYPPAPTGGGFYP